VTAAPPAVAHVGVTVPDLDAAVRWYGDVLALEAIGPPVEVRADEGHGGAVAADVFGPRFGRFRQAHLATANGVALELFEFADPGDGIVHFCLTTTAIDALAHRIAASGGRMRTSRVWDLFPGEPYRMCYCEDPFGNVLELYSHSHERVYSNRAP
jgi:catechol 2,3-dioxygenase-like lactoylglutathione lyase family enzyme